MKILYYGNDDNFGFRYCNWLRELGIYADLIYDPSRNYARSRLEWENPTINLEDIEWIYSVQGSPLDIFIKNRKVKKLIEKNSYDVILASGISIYKALCYDLPLIYRPIGGDITRRPFDSNSLKSELLSYLFRKKSKKISAVLAAQEDCYWASRLLGIKKFYFNPVPIDVKRINNNLNTEVYKNIRRKYDEYDLVIFNPTRKNLNPNRHDYKGSEIFLEALNVLFNKKNIHKKFNIKVIIGLHGNDVSEFIKYLESFNFSKELIDFVDHIPRPELHAYMKLPNLVTIDQFGDTSRINLCGTARESIGLGAPIVSAVKINDARFIESYSYSCPLLPAFTASEIVNQIHDLLNMNDTEFKRLKNKSIEWAMENIHWENKIDGFMEILKEIKSDN